MHQHTSFPIPVSELQDPERGVAVWQNETGGFEAGTVHDFIDHRRRQVDDHPHDPEARRELGRAYLWSGDAETALSILTPLHMARPGDREVQSLILDSLGLLDREPSTFPWIEPPRLVHLDRELLDGLHGLLAGELRPATVLDLCLSASELGHPTFHAGELLDALSDDGRFTVHPSDLAPECSVVLARLRPLAS